MIDIMEKLHAREAQLDRRSRRKASASEHDLQTACVQEFRLRNPRLRDLLIAIPNGGQRHVKVAAKLKAEGVVAGVPDLLLAVPAGEYHGLFIEMKNGSAGKVSEHQRRMMMILSQHGYKCEVCRTREEFFNTIQCYLEN